MSSSKGKSQEYRTELLAGLAELGRDPWDALVLADAADRGVAVASIGQAHPFVRFDWLNALEASASASPESGWTPMHLLLRDAKGELAGAAILYAKAHSWGEFVFDHAWADAHQRAGIAYFPKLVCAIPFTPVRGPRLLARDAHARCALASALVPLAQAAQLSSAHILFPQEADEAAIDTLTPADFLPNPPSDDPDEAQRRARRWLRRTGVQFHWTAQGWPDFEAFLDSLAQPKRKKIRAERRKVAESGVRVAVLEIAQTTAAQRDFFIACYERTYWEHGGPPYIQAACWQAVFESMPEHFALVVATRGTQMIAASLIAHDGYNAWGRYWGALERVPCLHFECCYYAPLEWAIARGLQRFEGGAQGEHKLARGLLPVATSSRHWLAHPAFESAIDRWLARERAGVSLYLDELDERSPIKMGQTSRDDAPADQG